MQKSFDFKDAPPTNAPSTSERANMSLELFGLTEPPYRILTFNLYKKPKIQLIVRLIKVNDSKCLRIIDGVGLECFEKKYLGILSEFISEEGLEYIDCICDPASAEIMINSGFSLNEKNKYVPHLFEPFNQKLTTVLYATTDPSIKIMKGDSDLDRPNV